MPRRIVLRRAKSILGGVHHESFIGVSDAAATTHIVN
jgi:hypothetical protein